MSTTPRTDAEACDGWSGDAIAVDVDFARTLETELAACEAALEASRKEVELNTAEWATLMADVHDYFKDERCDRGHGRVRLLLTLLGGLRCQRDDARAELASGKADTARLDWLDADPHNHADLAYWHFRSGGKARAAIDEAMVSGGIAK